jgi:hypothetical protein
MGQRIDQFCENLRQKLTMTDSGLEGLKTKIDAKKANVEQDVQSHLDRVRNRIEQNQAKLAAAQTNMKKKNWFDGQKATTSAQIADWKASVTPPSCRAGPARPRTTQPRRSMSRWSRSTRRRRPRSKPGSRARMPTPRKPSRQQWPERRSGPAPRGHTVASAATIRNSSN